MTGFESRHISDYPSGEPATTECDAVTRPSHYVIKDGVEVIDVREWWLRQTDDEFIGLAGGATTISHLERAMEYLLRAPGKNGMQDVRKAYQYLHRAIHGEWPGGDERVDKIVRERDRLLDRVAELESRGLAS
ncbi:MAG: DUF3310 domain-containing protein [Phycisphaerae bacterium]